MSTRGIIATGALACAALATPMAHGESAERELKQAPIDKLKNLYVECNRTAMLGRLGTGGIMHCSVVYEELMQRAFGGDFAKLIAWSRSQPPTQTTRR